MIIGTDEMVVVGMVIPAPDSHFRLMPCKCGSENVAYLRIRLENEELWAVRCLGCCETGKPSTVRHEAQLYWNKNKAAKQIIRRAI